MKLSEMTNDQAAEAMVRLAEPIGKLCDDEEAVKLIDEYKSKAKGPVFYIVGRLIPRLVGYFMQNHKREMYEIIGVLSGKKAEEIGTMNFSETVAIVRDSYDDLLATFFPSSGIAALGAGKKLSAS